MRSRNCVGENADAFGQPKPVVGPRQLDQDHPRLPRREAGADLVRAAERVLGPLQDQPRHRRDEQFRRPRLLGPAGQVQRKRQAHDSGHVEIRRGPAGDPGPSTATSEQQRSRAPRLVKDDGDGCPPPDVEARRRDGDPATGRPPGLFEADHGGSGGRQPTRQQFQIECTSRHPPPRAPASASPSVDPPRRRTADRCPPEWLPRRCGSRSGVLRKAGRRRWIEPRHRRRRMVPMRRRRAVRAATDRCSPPC